MKYIVIPLGLAIGLSLSFTYSAYAFTGTFTDVTASRSYNTSYQNTSGEDLWVTSSAEHGGNQRVIYFQISADNSTWETVSYSRSGSTDGNGEQGNVSGWVPVDYYYRVSGDDSPMEWWEYTTPAMSGGGGGSTISTDPILNALVATFLVLYTAQYVRRLFYS